MKPLQYGCGFDSQHVHNFEIRLGHPYENCWVAT